MRSVSQERFGVLEVVWGLFLPFLSLAIAWERRGRVVMLDSRSHHLFGPPLGLELCPSLK